MSITREEIIEAYESAVFSSGLSAAAGDAEEIEGGQAMSMTREEALNKLLEMLTIYPFQADEAQAIGKTLEVLRTPTREQVEKVWRGEWMGSADGYADGELIYDMWECSHCGYVIDEEDDPNMLPQFCPKCYSAMTDEAVDMMLERLEALHEYNA